MTRLTGRQATNYQGVQSSSPPNFQSYRRPPTPTDWQNFYLGDLWLVDNPLIATHLNVYILVSLRNNSAIWALFTAGGGDLTSLRADDGLIALPLAGVINIVGGTGITTTAAVANTITISVLGTIANQYTASSPVATPTVTGGNAFPLSNILNVQASHNISVSAGLPNTGAANDVVYWLNNTVTLGDLANLTAGNFAVKAQTGDITIQAQNNVGNFNMPNTVVSGDAGIITWGGTGSAFRWIHNFGLNNVFVGLQAGNTTLTAVAAFSNTGIGEDSLQALTTGHDNTAVGNQSLMFNTTSFACTAIGNGSLFAITAGANANTCVGNQTMFNATAGTGNVVVGSGAMQSILTGSNNIAIGFGAGNTYTGAESSNILIGSLGIIGESNTIRVGGGTGTGAGQQNRFFASGIRGITTGVADAIAVLIDSAGQLGTVSSSARYKDNIKPIADVSSRLYDLNPVQFNYKSYSEDKINYGLIAEEVDQVMPRLVIYDKDDNPETVRYDQLVPLMLNEIIKLNKRIEQLESI